MVSMSGMCCDRMGVGRSPVAQRDVIALAADCSVLWVCRNARQLMDRAERVRRAEEGKVCFLYCPHTGCNFLFMNVPWWNWGTEADYRPGTNCLGDPASPGSQRQGFFF